MATPIEYGLVGGMLVVVVLGGIHACVPSPPSNTTKTIAASSPPRGFERDNTDRSFIKVVTDPVTGCEYLVADASGITIRHNQDGSLSCPAIKQNTDKDDK